MFMSVTWVEALGCYCSQVDRQVYVSSRVSSGTEDTEIIRSAANTITNEARSSNRDGMMLAKDGRI